MGEKRRGDGKAPALRRKREKGSRRTLEGNFGSANRTAERSRVFSFIREVFGQGKKKMGKDSERGGRKKRSSGGGFPSQKG